MYDHILKSSLFLFVIVTYDIQNENPMTYEQRIKAYISYNYINIV